MTPYPLTPAEVQAHQHSKALGHSVAIHYPVLPTWDEYSGGGKADKTKTGWTSGKWGVEGWTGYGWDGGKLPNTDGLSFGAPMPQGLPLDTDEGKKKKGGGGDGGGDGGGKKEEGEGEKEKGPPAKGGDAIEGADATGGDGGGNKKNKKKK